MYRRCAIHSGKLFQLVDTKIVHICLLILIQMWNHYVVVASALLIVAGVFATGLSYNIGWAVMVPGAVLLAYSGIVLSFALVDGKIIVSVFQTSFVSRK